MKIINLLNGQTFRTSNDEAGEFIERIAAGDGVTLSDYNDLEGEVKEIVDRFIAWNNVYADNDYETLCLKDGVYNEYKGSGYQMSFDEFVEEFYTEL